ncbi:hypothetical protein K9M79_02810 [Candidatus Woesearchaeota archaeon]|nr:hypothetical protein [Candidatus Woesearchaeota archaeon]
MDLLGTSRTIQIDGRFTGTTAQLRTFITTIEGIQNGQQTGSAYVGDLVVTSKTVQIQTFSWTYEKANLGEVTYSLTLVEGTVI